MRQSLVFPRVVFLSPACELDEDLRKRRELVSHCQIDDFLRSFREGYVVWISDALTPSWLSGERFFKRLKHLKMVNNKCILICFKQLDSSPLKRGCLVFSH